MCVCVSQTHRLTPFSTAHTCRGSATPLRQTHAINSRLCYIFFTWRPFKFQFLIVHCDKRLHLFDVVIARINAMPFSQSICMFSGWIATASISADNFSFLSEFHGERDFSRDWRRRQHAQMQQAHTITSSTSHIKRNIHSNGT